jgi:hypothetical protein
MAEKKRQDASNPLSLEHLDQVEFVLPDGTRVRGDRLTAQNKALPTAAVTHNAVDYETDFYAWTLEQARLLRAGEFSAIDAANIAEEIESMGRSDRRELQSRLVVLTMHLLKWRQQPGIRSRSWSATIDEQRLQIENVMAESPSLRPAAAGMLAQAYAIARARTIAETGLADDAFPATCPFTVAEVLSGSFLPAP